MNKSTIVGLVVVLIVIVAAIALAGRKNQPIATLTPTESATVMPSESVSPSASPLVSVGVSVGVSPTPAPMKATITYTNAGFSLSLVTIKQGGTVTWVNNSSHDMWPASGQHPTHNVYPEPGGCIGSKFDACGHIAPGQSWSFTFTKVGTWGYHDHLNPQFTGKVTVQ